MSVEVVVPESYHGRRDRRPQLAARPDPRHEPARERQVMRAEVPLATMFGYATDLRSKTQGRATYTMQFSHYAPVPQAIQEEIVAKQRG